MKIVYIIVSIIAILVAILFCFLTAGCVSVREVTMKKAVVTPHIEQIEMTGRIDGKPITMTGKAVIRSREGRDIPADLSVNYRKMGGIKLVWGHLFALIKVWFWDLLIVTLLICILTEVLGNYVRPAGIKIPKIMLSFLSGGLIGIFYVLFLSADWLYVTYLAGVSVAVANILWQYVINQWGGNKVVDKIIHLFKRR